MSTKIKLHTRTSQAVKVRICISHPGKWFNGWTTRSPAGLIIRLKSIKYIYIIVKLLERLKAEFGMDLM